MPSSSTALARLPPPLPMLALVQHALRLAPKAGKAQTSRAVAPPAQRRIVAAFRVLAEWLLSRTGVVVRHAFSSRATRVAALDKWYGSRIPVGLHPVRSVRIGLVPPDDCDFLLHLSNSSYPQALDRARMRMAIHTFPNFLRCGGSAPLAATHFHFIREILLFVPCEVRAWDDKWGAFLRAAGLLVIARGTAEERPLPATNAPHAPSCECAYARLGSRMRAPSPPPLATYGPSRSRLQEIQQVLTPAVEPGAGAAEVMTSDSTAQALLARAGAQTDPGGAVLYSVTVAQLCYKLGRRTVPPAAVLAANGVSAPLAADTSADSSPQPRFPGRRT
ncbi:hypothetical protein FB451DRAFT_1560147 [Mycena latifolia]|nr:hypothetical protein FB451DRAFT_1560147 [Mycena latifolia]